MGPYCNEADVAALNAFYRNAGGKDWTNSQGWSGDGAVSEWYGVSTDSLGRVTGLDPEWERSDRTPSQNLGPTGATDRFADRLQRPFRQVAAGTGPSLSSGVPLRGHRAVRSGLRSPSKHG